MLFLRPVVGKIGPDEFNYGTIDHLLASIGKIHRYIGADNRLNLANPPFRTGRVCHKVAKGEIEHLSDTILLQILPQDRGAGAKKGA